MVQAKRRAVGYKWNVKIGSKSRSRTLNALRKRKTPTFVRKNRGTDGDSGQEWTPVGKV